MFESINNSNQAKTFNEVFIVGKEYHSLSDARQEALNFGKENNVLFVTTNSNTTRQSLLLRCKHGNTPRAKKEVNEDEEKKKYHKDTQRFNCPCFIKYGKSSSGKVVIRACHDGHNHPIPKKATTYALYRRQSNEVMGMILKTLALSSANPVETVMQVQTLKMLL